MEKPAPQTWRELLYDLVIPYPEERRRAAAVLQVDEYTLTRWAKGQVRPRPENLQKLPEAFPRYRAQFQRLIEAELHPDVSLPALPPSAPDIPSWYYFQALRLYSSVRNPFSVWSMQKQTLEQLREHLTRPERIGLDLSLVRCVPPRSQQIRSLCETIGIGTPPWSESTSRRLLFLGREALAGWVTESGEPGIIQDLDEPGLLPFRRDGDERSAAAYPLQRAGNVAGCLLAVSSSVAAWTERRLSFLEAYALILALSFQDEEFYPLSQIRLREVPTLDAPARVAMPSTFRERVRALRREQPSLSLAEAERSILQQLEAELLEEL